MQYLFTAKQAKQLDEHAIQEVGFPGAVLMEKAATVLSSVIEQSIRKDEGILFVCDVAITAEMRLRRQEY